MSPISSQKDPRPAMRQFEAPQPGACRPCKSPLFVPEEFAFEQLLRYGPAIDRHQREIAPVAVEMDGLGHKFLACSAFAINDDRAVGSGYFSIVVKIRFMLSL